jgi:DNA-binding transcriptional LysR family regulator
MTHVNLDLNALRTLVLSDDLGGFSHAAAHLGKTPSAISLQMKRLQTAVGVPLFRRQGRKTLLTEQGEVALRHARRVLAMNDDMVDALKGASQSGTLRMGFAEDFVGTIVSSVLIQFAVVYPLVQLEIVIDRSSVLKDQLEHGKLDLALLISQTAEKPALKIADMPLCWVGNSKYVERSQLPLPLVLFEPPCAFRTLALDSLDKVGRPWRVAATSASLSGLWAAVSAGVGVTARSLYDLPGELQILQAGLPPLGSIPVILQRRRNLRTGHIIRAAEITEQLVRSQIASQTR